MNGSRTDSKSFEIARRFLGTKVHVAFDQPVGSSYAPFGIGRYPVNYGYVPGVPAPDGDDLDAYFLGTSAPLHEADGIRIAIVHRLDDDDDKLVVVPEGMSLSDEEDHQPGPISGAVLLERNPPEMTSP